MRLWIILLFVAILVTSTSIDLAYAQETGWLSGKGGGSVLVLKDGPSDKGVLNISQENALCLVPNGTKARLIERKGVLAKIEILDGDCADKIGWIFLENFRVK